MSTSSLPTPSLYAAQPTVAVDDSEQPSLSVSVLSASVEETTEGMRRCEVRFGNWGETGRGLGFVLSDRRLLEFGRAIRIEMGAGERQGRLFEGPITGLEEHYPAGRVPELVVLAEDRLQDLRMTRRTRTFTEATDADVLRQIASEHGLRPEVDVDTRRHGVLAQVNQSDLAFARSRARAIDAQLWLDGDALRVQARGRRDAGSLTLTYGVDLWEFSVLADLAHQRTAVRVSGWDVGAKRPLAHEATVTAVSPELGGDTAGASILEKALGGRVEQVVNEVPLSSEETQAVAEACFRARARRFLTGAGTAEGDARLTVGAAVELIGLSPAFSGSYYVTAVHHRYDGTGGFRTTFRVERPGLGGPA